MTRLTTLDLQPFYRNSIGIDRWFDTVLDSIEHSSTTNYPPYNIVKKDDDNYTIELAVAGFTEGEINVTTHDGQLVIKGEKVEQEEEQNYLHKGISARKFERSFTLNDYVEVASATVANGILSIDLERHVPESMKPKTIAIDYKS
jgi:molecular chaperone IbpA